MVKSYLQQLADNGCKPGGGDIFRQNVFSVAEGSIPYNQAVIWKDGWRQDCSGHACRAMGTYKNGPGAYGGFSTETLATYGVIYPIPLSEATVGDYLGTCGPGTESGGDGPTGHIAPIIGRTGPTFMVFDHGSGMGPTRRNAPNTAAWAKQAWRYVFNGNATPPVLGDEKVTWQRGSFGGPVRDIQGIVGAAVDGVFGPLTEVAVRNWQNSHGLRADGLVGPLTQAAMVPFLDDAITPPPPAPDPTPTPTPTPTPAPSDISEEYIRHIATEQATAVLHAMMNDLRTVLHDVFAGFGDNISKFADSIETVPGKVDGN